MKLDVNQINHNYIVRLVILAIFLYKKMKNQELVYQEAIRTYLEKRLGFETYLQIEVGPKMSKVDSRDQRISDILDDVEDEDRGVMNLVTASFKTGLKEVNLQVNLNQEEKYELYLYG